MNRVSWLSNLHLSIFLPAAAVLLGLGLSGLASPPAADAQLLASQPSQPGVRATRRPGGQSVLPDRQSSLAPDQLLQPGLVEELVPIDETITATLTLTETDTPIPAGTEMATVIPSVTLTPSPTITSTLTRYLVYLALVLRSSPPPTPTDTPTPTSTSTLPPVDETITATLTLTETNTPIPTVTETATIIPSLTPTETETPVPTATETATATPTLTLTETDTPLPSATETATSTSTATFTTSPTVIPTPTRYLVYLALVLRSLPPPPTLTPTATKTTTPTSTRTSTPAWTPTLMPSPTPTFPPNAEVRAVWVSRYDLCNFQSPCPNQVQTMVNNIAAGHFNMILLQVRATGDAFYRPGLEPWSSMLAGCLGCDPGWDPLEQMITAAHAKGIQVHAYLNQYSAWTDTTLPPCNTVPQHPTCAWSNSFGTGWQVWDQYGRPAGKVDDYLWASPGVRAVDGEDVEDHLVAVAQDIVSRYAVDGVHLDRVRYPGAPAGLEFSHDPTSQSHYNQQCCESWGDWQRDQVSSLVRRMYNEVIVPKNQRLVLSAAVWPVYQTAPSACGPTSNGYYERYQDSHGWLRDGIIDMNFYMIYGSGSIFDTSYGCWDGLMRDHVDHDYGRYAVPGIGGSISFSEISRRIDDARAYGAAGVSFYSYRYLNDNGYWDDFANGPFHDLVVPPPPTWHP